MLYDLYVTNGPNLIVADPTAAGSLAFDNFHDLNNNKAVGGRIGFLPVPNIEMGYSAMFAKVQPQNFSSVRALLQALDFNWRQDVDSLGGRFDCRAEWVFSNVGRATYGGPGTGFGPINYSNYRDGGYVQLTYRPLKASNPIVQNFELAGRWDYLKTPTASPGGNTEQRTPWASITGSTPKPFSNAITNGTARKSALHKMHSSFNSASGCNQRSERTSPCLRS